MFCPECGIENSTDLSYCRSCGMNLSGTILQIKRQYKSIEGPTLGREERWLEKFGLIAFGGFGIIIWISILTFIYFLVTRFILKGELVGLIAAILGLFLIFAGMIFSYVYWRKVLDTRVKMLHSADLRGELVSRPETPVTKGFERAPASVTEGTTRKLSDDDDWAMF